LIGNYDAGWDLTCVDFRICDTFELVAKAATLAEFCDRMLIVWPTEQQVRIELPDSDAVKVRTAHCTTTALRHTPPHILYLANGGFVLGKHVSDSYNALGSLN
jgi:hypothetical protein